MLQAPLLYYISIDFLGTIWYNSSVQAFYIIILNIWKENYGGNELMKKTMFQKVLCLILSATTLLGVFVFSAAAATTGELRGTNRDT